MDLGWRLAERVSEEKSLEETVVELLAKNRLSVTTAESCTGGLIAGTIVNVAGASDVLNEGYVTYSNEDTRPLKDSGRSAKRLPGRWRKEPPAEQGQTLP